LEDLLKKNGAIVISKLSLKIIFKVQDDIRKSDYVIVKNVNS